MKGHADFTNKYTSDSSIGNQSSHRYDDIINLPHHASASHPRMPLNDRAAQFAPFAALTGHSTAIRNTAEAVEEEESLSLEEVEKEMIRKALEKHNGRRKNAAADLKISERTLYRKIKEYNLE